jgi:hypothetical protein
MKPGGYILAIVLFSNIPAPKCRALSDDGDRQTSHQLSLADLAGYRVSRLPTWPGLPIRRSGRASKTFGIARMLFEAGV